MMHARVDAFLVGHRLNARHVMT